MMKKCKGWCKMLSTIRIHIMKLMMWLTYHYGKL